MAAGKFGKGTAIAYSDDSGANYVPWAHVTDVKPFAAKADDIDVTAHDSPSNYREFIPGLLQAGDASFQLNYDDKDTGHKWALTNLGVAKKFKVTGPGGTPATIVFDGYVNKLDPDYPDDKQLTASVGIKITGPMTIA